MSIGSGIGQEVLLLAIPFALATRAGWKPCAIVALPVGLPLSIHLYCGGGALLVLLRIPAAYLLYRATRSILPPILGHVGYDLLAVTPATLTSRAHPDTGPAGRVGGRRAALLAATTGLLPRRQPRRHRRRSDPMRQIRKRLDPGSRSPAILAAQTNRTPARSSRW